MQPEKQVIRGYELQKQLGIGGFGAVYLAYQPLLKRDVAIKVILPEHANNPDFIRRFEVEAELVARLESPHIVPLFDYWREPNGAYLVMRFLRGGSLRDKLSEGKIPPEQVVAMFDQITQALHVAHRNGVVHRDIKPANIMLDEDGNAYLTDFGIAKTDKYDELDDGGEAELSGSIPYISPEQIQSRDITPQADIYALGVMLYELLTGNHPFEVELITELLMKHMNEPVPSIMLVDDSMPYEVDEVIQKATAKDANERFSDVREMGKALREALSNNSSVDMSGMDFFDFEEVSDVELVNPYKGLRAFQEADADQFFGRIALVDSLLARMGEESLQARFLAVVGPSGSGKSSVVKAGLLPELRGGALPNSENWFITEMFPGSNPFAELESAIQRVALFTADELPDLLREEDGINRAVSRVLPRDESELVIVIDQFEELFTQIEDDSIREAFLNNIVAITTNADSRVRVIVTLRADFYDKPLHYHTFAELFRQRMETVLPMTPEELAQSIVEPAFQVGAELQIGLVDTIIKDVSDQPGMLPLLQYALTELFERRLGNLMTLEAYTDIGGVTGALARRAEDIFQEMAEMEQRAVRQLFLRLITLGEGTEDTRRRVRQTELPEQDGIDTALQSYGDFRLLTFDRDPVTRGPTVEVAHEALIRTWQRLREWVTEDREALRIHRRLTVATHEWQQTSQDASFLATGSRLAQFEEWAKTTNIALNESEQAYLDASIQQRLDKLKAEEERRKHDEAIARRVQNFQRASVVLAFMVLLAFGATIVASLTAVNAREESEIANTQVADANSALTAVPPTLTEVNQQVVDSLALVDFIGLELGRFSTLQAGDVIVPLRTQTPGIFEPTLTAVAELIAFEPQSMIDESGVEMMLVPAGCFIMGSDTGDSNERPTHQQCFEESFWIDKTEVTNAQYGSVGDSDCNFSNAVEPEQPRNCVNWVDAQAYCESRGGTLPTEAQWEYAARGPNSLIYPWGNSFVADNVVFGETSNDEIAPVGSRPEGASWVGALDMSGNVWEWTSSPLLDYPFDANAESETVNSRVLRGGSFFDTANAVRTAYRFDNDLTLGFNDFGFRCIRLNPPEED